MIGTVMLGAWQAGWYGTPATPLLIWPFAMMAGGGLTLVTVWGMLGALTQNVGLLAVLGTLSAGAALTAAGFFAGSLPVDRAGGVLYVISAAAAWLAAGAMTLEHSFGRTVIPLGKWRKQANIPGRVATDPLAYPVGMPGVKVGQ